MNFRWKFNGELICAIIVGVWVFLTGAPLISAALTIVVAFVMFVVYLWVWNRISNHWSARKESDSRSDSRS